MNYENLYQELDTIEKALKDSAAQAARQVKAAQKNTESGNLPELKKALEQLSATASLLSERVGKAQEALDSFDTRAYFVSGDFTQQLLQACRDRGIDVQGEKGVYEMFPYKVRVYGDSDHTEEVWINRKKLASFRPSAVADTIRDGQERLRKVRFNASAFMKELAEAYDTTILRDGARMGSTITLTKIYKTLTPMARARKDYDMQAFAFDLARVYELGTEAWVTPSGRTFYFGTSRDGKNAIRVLSASGVETFITTLKPLSQGEDA